MGCCQPARGGCSLHVSCHARSNACRLLGPPHACTRSLRACLPASPRSMPAAPVIDSVVVEPPTDREAFGHIAVTITIPKDGGSGGLPPCRVAAPPPQQAWAACPAVAGAAADASCACARPAPPPPVLVQRSRASLCWASLRRRTMGTPPSCRQAWATGWRAARCARTHAGRGSVERGTRRGRRAGAELARACVPSCGCPPARRH